jgi:hypothetical protein
VRFGAVPDSREFPILHRSDGEPNPAPPIPLQETNMSRVPVRPYLVSKDEEGVFRVTVRTTRYNSQNYPLVSSEVLEEAFRTQTAARAFVRETYRAEANEIATK